MRSYYAHLATVQTPKKNLVKPTFRSSAIFPVFNMPGIRSRILFMGYWILKRHIHQISAVVTLRSEEGELLHRQTFLIEEARSYSIELSEQLVACGFKEDTHFMGSLEIEFFSTANLFFPYPATVINYYGPHFSSVVHTAQRVYNDFEDMHRNSETAVAESGFNLYADEEHEPFFGFINGPEDTPESMIQMEFFNADHEVLTYEMPLGSLAPYQTSVIYPARIVDLKQFLKGKPGAAKIGFHVNWVFPRIVVGTLQRSLPAMTITHTYYDCTQAHAESDFWMPSQPEWYPATLILPACVRDDLFTKIYFYPIYSPSSLTFDVEIYNSQGTKLGRTQDLLAIQSPSDQVRSIDVKTLCKTCNIDLNQDLGIRLIARTVGNSRFPARVKIGFDVGEDRDREMSCNICTNLQPFNPSLENKPSSFRWSPILADQPKAELWIMNSAPHVDYRKNAEIQLTFYREQDNATLSRTLVLPPHGFSVIRPQEDPELDAFFRNKTGWCTAVTSNPYTTNYYFSYNPSGVVGGDHGF